MSKEMKYGLWSIIIILSVSMILHNNTWLKHHPDPQCIERIDTLDTGLPRRVGSHRIDSITRDTLWDDQDRDEYQSKHNSFTRYFRIGTTCDSGRIYVTHWCTAVENLVIVGSFKTDTIWTNCADQQWEMKQEIERMKSIGG